MYEVILDELVLTEDFPRIDPADRQRILRAVRKKLTHDPEGYGAPLRGPLKGYWKLKVGQYRVVYKIQKDRVVVYVIAVGFRRRGKVYDESVKRGGK